MPKRRNLDSTKGQAVSKARQLNAQTRAIKVGYNGGTTEQTRRKYWQEEPVMRHAVDSVAGRYGINPMLLANRMEWEGFVDNQIKDRNSLIKRKQPQGIARGYEILHDAPGIEQGYNEFGTDDSKTYINKRQARLINERWSPYKRPNDNGRVVQNAAGLTTVDNMGIQASLLKMFRDQAKKDFPGKSEAEYDSMAAAYYNRGRGGGRNYVKSGKKDSRYTIRSKYAKGGRTYSIRRGDTLSKIAAANNISLEDILALNASIKNPDLIYAGGTLNLPGVIEQVQPQVQKQQAIRTPEYYANFMPQPLEQATFNDLLTVFGRVPKASSNKKRSITEVIPTSDGRVVPIKSRSHYWKVDPIMSQAVDSIAQEYGIPGRVLKERLNREGFVDDMIQLNRAYRNSNPGPERDAINFTQGYSTLHRPEIEEYGPVLYGTDWAGAMLKKGAINLKNEMSYYHPFTNEVNQVTDAASGPTVADNIGIMASMLKYFRDAAKRDFPNAKGKTLDDYTMIYYNRGEPNARKYIKSGKYKGHYNS